MDKALKLKLSMFFLMMFFMMGYMLIFGRVNAVIGLMVVVAAVLNLGNDLSYKPKLSFIKLFSLLMILGIVSYINTPITVFGCILTFFIVFGTTFTSYHLFGTHVYLPFLVIYFMMLVMPVPLDGLPIRLLSLAIGALFIVSLNLMINNKKYSKLSKLTLFSLIDELCNAVDLKLEGKEVSINSFNVANGFYRSIFSKFEYKYFPNPKHESIINVVKSFQYIGWVLSKYGLSENELMYLKRVLMDIKSFKFSEIGEITVETKEMNMVLLNLKIIENEAFNKNMEKENKIPNIHIILSVLKPLIKRQFSFKSAKFTFAFKMAVVLTLWEVLTLIFNFPYTKWLYFASIPLMLPYIDDVAHTAKSRMGGTLIGVSAFAVIMIALQYIPISSYMAMVIVLIAALFGMVFSLQNKLKLSSFTTLMSVTVSLVYITPPKAIELKILWVAVAMIVVTIINYGFLPFSVEKETKNNLKASYVLNKRFVNLIKLKCEGKIINKTPLLVVSSMVHENIEINNNNEELYQIQSKITNVSNSILNYMEIYEISPEMKIKIIKLIENEGNFNNHENIILNSVNYVVNLLNKEKNLINNI
ncbi:Fusaric acid resistance protein-like [Methanobrevibacter gottschalkii]|uniref:Fusaric acid resistance protein-like n=1 Tax=Methanobrevibacter gottschalkii TaxID=190974 RepID=A0A1H7MMB2_9EURY|nr:FUSC family protein [Methanobrevibacter gottschalkii]SEL12460.1 Fusaric acid resistance protein-like [Methanobrevibacter gottschalkii]